MGLILDRAAILAASDLKSEDVLVPQWGGTVRVRTMTGQQRDEFRAMLAEKGAIPIGMFQAALLAATLVDDQGDPLFTPKDIAALQAKAGAALDVPVEVAMRLNGLGERGHEAALKNSASGQSVDSGTGLPSSSGEVSASAS